MFGGRAEAIRCHAGNDGLGYYANGRMPSTLSSAIVHGRGMATMATSLSRPRPGSPGRYPARVLLGDSVTVTVVVIACAVVLVAAVLGIVRLARGKKE